MNDYYNTVDVKVGSAIRQWVIYTYGSDTIRLSKGQNLWAIVKQNLELLPQDYKILSDRSEYISIVLLATRGNREPIFNYPSDRMLHLNELYRCYISPAGQNAIKRYLENQFRHSFTVYMIGRQSESGGKIKIQAAISDFLQDFGLDVTAKRLSTLSKYWYRFRVKYPDKYPLPIFF
jgi:hypothetical protein